MKSIHRDVVIVGAGLSGINMACRLGESNPELSFTILESRDDLGGTWDLFRYPGIRSDSDMQTLSYPFRPWTNPETIARGGAILDYLRETAQEYGVTEQIRYGHKVIGASWDSSSARWTIKVETAEGLIEHTANFLYLATGYYSYDSGHVVEFPGREDFAGDIVHPQFWPSDLDASGKRFVIIGSGATAVTLVPALLKEGAQHVTMLQRSPTYMVSLPGTDPSNALLARVLPEKVARKALRAKALAVSIGSYHAMRAFPKVARKVLTVGAARSLPRGYEVSTHFNPRYNPWDERLCVVPDADLFKAVSSGDADIVTDTVDTFTSTGVQTSGGQHLDADVVVTATGLTMVAAGNISFVVDGASVKVSDGYVYKGLMLSDLPNVAWCVGYTNNSWTLRSDLSARYVCRLLAFMRRGGYTTVTPTHAPDGPDGGPLLDLSSGYIKRAAGVLPKQGAKAPWKVRQNYFVDLVTVLGAKVDDGHLRFTRAGRSGTPGGGASAIGGASDIEDQASVLR